MIRKFGAVTLASALLFQAALPALASTAKPNPVETGRTEAKVNTGVITPNGSLVKSNTLTGTVLIDGPKLVMTVTSDGQAVPGAKAETFAVSDKLFGYKIEVPGDGKYTIGARTVYANGKHAGQTHTQASPIAVEVDRTAPVITITPYSTNPTNQNVEVFASTNEGTLNASSYIFESNGSFEFVATDAAGNESKRLVTIGHMDFVSPTAGVSYSTTSPVNTSVTASLADLSEEITVTNNGGDASYTFEENGSFTFEFIDAAGNAGSATATVANIDKTSPVGTVQYTTTAPTNQAVTADITFSKPNVRVTNNNGSTSYTFEENGSFTFEYIDVAGNTGTTEVSVANIDKEAPTATVHYSTVHPTNGSVTATVLPSEHVTITNNEGSAAYSFDENGTFTFAFVDAAGNTGTATAEVANIDKVAPVANVEYSTVELTNGDVVATIAPSEEILVTNHDSTSYTFTENGTFTFEFTDLAGNQGTAAATVTNIDKTVPTATVGYSMQELTNGDVAATIAPSEEITVTNNDGSLTYTFTENGEFTFEFVDRAGNAGFVTAAVANIDKTAPTAEVAYSTTSLVNTDVVVTLANISEPITVTNTVDGSLTHTFTENGAFTFEFTDAAGNAGTATATVANIDKTSPVGSVAYSTTDPTNQEVTVFLTFSKANVTVTNNDGSASYTFSENGTFTFEFVDAAGNTGSTDIAVNNIDKMVPVASVSYSATTATNGDVTATISPSESVAILNNNGSASYTFVQNGEFVFQFVDAAGNIGSATAVVANIDKDAPTATISYSTTAATNTDVVATMTPNEVVTVTNNDGLSSRAFTQNGNYTFTFADAAGNTGSVTALVNNIDKTAPIVSGVANGQTYTASVAPTFTEGTATLNGQPYLSGTTIAANGSYTLTVTDAAGNAASVQFSLNLTPVVHSIVFASFTLQKQGENQFKVIATYTVQYTNGTTKSVTNQELSGGTIANPTTSNQNSSTKDYTVEGLVYTITVAYHSKSDQYQVTAVKK